MMRPRLIVLVMAAAALQVHAQTPPAPVPQHEANFDAERKQANDLYLATKPLEALPLYEDLCRQDPTIAVFAERHAAGLFAKEATIADPNARLQVHLSGIKEIKRAQSLGDNSAYVRAALEADSKTLVGAILSGIPLTVGYTYHGNLEAQQPFREAEAAFARSEWLPAAKLYIKAANLDPAWYDAALYAGDSYFHLTDLSHASVWFSKAVAIDPNRETAYRYWGDAMMKTCDQVCAREKFVHAVIAEPYAQPPMAELMQWAKRTGHQIVTPAILRPEFTTPNGVLKIDPDLAASTQDGRSSWIVYQQYRVDHGARTLQQQVVAGGGDSNGVLTPSGYRHTIAEEHAALRAMLADIDARMVAGTLLEANLDPSIRNIRIFEHSDMLGAWIAINAADAGIRSDYTQYRSNHRKHLLDYVNTYLIR